MPRPKKPARVIYSEAHGQYRIHDGDDRILTGARGRSSTADAEAALNRHLAGKRIEAPTNAGLDQVDIDILLALYVTDMQGRVEGWATLCGCVERLAEFWVGMTPADINSQRCRDYAAHRAKPRTVAITTRTGRVVHQTYTAGPDKVRRELGVLVAAINHAHAEGVLSATRKVPLPPAGPAKDRWLRRHELAWLLWASRDTWVTTRAGERKRVEDRTHLRRFIITAKESGRRATAICQLRFRKGPGGGNIDLQAGIIDFRIPKKKETKKRRGGCKMSRRLWSQMRRWRRMGGEFLIESDGRPIAEIDAAFNAACRRAKKMHRAWIARTGRDEDPIDLSDVTPHTLKHTAITYYFQNGGELARGAKYFATSSRTLENIYFTHSPLEQDRDAEIMQHAGRHRRPKMTQNTAA